MFQILCKSSDLSMYIFHVGLLQIENTNWNAENQPRYFRIHLSYSNEWLILLFMFKGVRLLEFCWLCASVWKNPCSCSWGVPFPIKVIVHPEIKTSLTHPHVSPNLAFFFLWNIKESIFGTRDVCFLCIQWKSMIRLKLSLKYADLCSVESHRGLK